MVNINEKGIWTADGNGVGENLILNGNMVEFNGTYVSGATCHWGNWANATDRSLVKKDGKYWLHYKTSATTTYGGFYQDNGLNGDIIRIKPNTYYTVSATWFASEDIGGIFWLHMRSSEGGANISQPFKKINVTSTPTRFSYTFNSGSNDSYTINRFNLMMGSYQHATEGVDVYFTDVKMEEGQIATPYIQNQHDPSYITNSHGFFEGYNAKIWEGSIGGEEFIEL